MEFEYTLLVDYPVPSGAIICCFGSPIRLALPHQKKQPWQVGGLIGDPPATIGYLLLQHYEAYMKYIEVVKIRLLTPVFHIC